MSGAKAMRTSRGLLTVLSVVALLTIAGCGLVSSSGTFKTGALPDGAKPLAGAELVVTSKSFTEGVILGKITASYLALSLIHISEPTRPY